MGGGGDPKISQTSYKHGPSDVIALLVALFSVYISGKPWQNSTFGYARAEVVGAMINAVFLMALCFTIVIDSAKASMKMSKELLSQKT